MFSREENCNTTYSFCSVEVWVCDIQIGISKITIPRWHIERKITWNFENLKIMGTSNEERSTKVNIKWSGLDMLKVKKWACCVLVMCNVLKCPQSSYIDGIMKPFFLTTLVNICADLKSSPIMLSMAWALCSTSTPSYKGKMKRDVSHM